MKMDIFCIRQLIGSTPPRTYILTWNKHPQALGDHFQLQGDCRGHLERGKLQTKVWLRLTIITPTQIGKALQIIVV